MSKPEHGFVIKEFIESLDWKLLPITKDVPMNSDVICPACGGEEQVLCTLVGRGGEQKMRIGCCDLCGYVGYIDRPTKSWTSHFYESMWDDAKDATERAASQSRALIAPKEKRRDEVFAKFLERFGGQSDKSRYVCEMGSGYGATLRMLKNRGFEKIIGTENSLHRAEAASRAIGAPVIPGPFEDEKTVAELKKRAPFAVIISHHVIEHTYDPGEIIDLCNSLQSEGDFVIFSLPNIQSGETALSTLLYLPHLHSFTKTSFTSLLNGGGYEVVDDSFGTSYEIFVIAKKRGSGWLAPSLPAVSLSNPPAVSASNPSRRLAPSMSRWGELPKPVGNYFDRTLGRFNTALGLHRTYRSSFRILYAFRKINLGGQLSYFGPKQFRSFYWRFMVPLIRLKNKKRMIAEVGVKKSGKTNPMLALIVEDLQKRYCDADESPLEIQFEDNITLTYK